MARKCSGSTLNSCSIGRYDLLIDRFLLIVVIIIINEAVEPIDDRIDDGLVDHAQPLQVIDRPGQGQEATPRVETGFSGDLGQDLGRQSVGLSHLGNPSSSWSGSD